MPPPLQKKIQNVFSQKGNFLFPQAVQRLYRILREAVKKFKLDHCSIRANAIAYAVVISIIPLLTIFIQVAKINRSVLQANIASFLAAYGLSDSTELFVILDEIMARAETIAGVGFIFVLYSATNFFRNLEEAFNYIYDVHEKRPFPYRVSLYLAAFILLPLITIFTGQAIQSIRHRFQAPELRQVLPTKSHKWVVASDGNLWFYTQGKRRKIDLKTKTNPAAPYRRVFIDLKSKRSGYSWEVIGGRSRSQQLITHSRYDLIAAVQDSQRVYVVSSGAVLYYSDDEGQTWEYQQLIFRSDSDLYTPRVKDIHITDQGSILLLVDETSHSGLVLSEGERRWRYSPLDSIYNRIVAVDNIDPLKNTGSFNNGLYLLGKGNYLYSTDKGKTWEGPFEERYGDRKFRITALQADAQGNMYFGGQNGAFWIRKATERFYPDLRTRFDQDVRGFTIRPDGSGVLYGSGRLFRYTADGGQTWHLSETQVFSEVDLLAHLYTEEGKLYFTGKNNILLLTSPPQLTKKYDQSGHALVSLDYKILSQTRLRESLLQAVFLEPLIFVVLFVILTLLYRLVPNTRVRFSAATLGAAISSFGILAFWSFFRIWIANFTTTGYIYGAWAVIPLGMLIILISTHILLFGLEIAFVAQSNSGASQKTQ